jgi:N-acyl-D-amino-acid deacylase
MPELLNGLKDKQRGMVAMEFDVLIRNGRVVDGTHNATATLADVGINGDRIEVIGKLGDATAATVIDAAGKIVAPGFIDVHIHSEIELLGGEHRYASLLQGVTTQLLTPDGFGWAPLTPEQARDLWVATVAIYGNLQIEPNWPTPQAFLKIFEGNTPANVLPQVPHTAVRLAAMGWDARPATDDELEHMRGLVRQWMEAGATCLCLGLDYQPSAYADTRELIELSKVAGEYDGIYTAHIRNNEIGREAAWRETMVIGKESGIPVHLSHEYVDDLTAPLLDEADDLCDLTFESYMYPAGCTHLLNMLSIPLQAGGPDGVRQRLNDPEGRKQMRDHFQKRLSSDRAKGADAVFANSRTGKYIGTSLFDAAEAENMEPGDFAMKIFDEEYPESLMVYHRGGTPEQHQDMVARTISHPKMMVASDGIYNGPHAHPRGYGCFSRALRLGVRELGAISLEEAIYKMSGFPAERFRIKDRGFLKEGFDADIVVFDPDTVADRSTWEQPRLEPVGIDRVLVNGKIVINQGSPTGEIPGKVLG